MKTDTSSGDYTELLTLLWQFHCALNTVWPKPGVPEMAGASAFVGTGLFKGLKNGMCQIQDTLHSLRNPGLRDEVAPFWNAFTRLFCTLGEQDRYKKSDQVDSAFNLLYLASGVFYHHVAELSSKLPETDKRLIGVEELKDLVRLCRWPTDAQNAKSIFDSLVSEMTASARGLETPEIK